MHKKKHRYFVINKPANMVSQFVSTHQVGLLGDIEFKFPEGIHAIGRLDSHSEGLLILTTNKKVTKLLFQGTVPHKRVYLVQVKNIVSQETLHQLKIGVNIQIKGGIDYTTAPCAVSIETNPEKFCVLPVNKSLYYVPDTWLLITLTEGKFHQVRKMVAAVHHKCIRLIRIAIEDILLEDLQPGAVREIEENEFFSSLKIENW